MNDPYDYIIPRPTGDGDFAAQCILLMRLPPWRYRLLLVHGGCIPGFISSLWAHPTRHDW
jgi:hypothetical protein